MARCLMGIVTGTRVGTQCAPDRVGSCRRGCDLPGFGRFGPKDPKRAARDEVTLNIEGVVNGSVSGQDALGRASRFEPLQLPLSPSYHLMGVLGPIVLT